MLNFIIRKGKELKVPFWESDKGQEPWRKKKGPKWGKGKRGKKN